MKISSFRVLIVLMLMAQNVMADSGKGTYIWPEYQKISVPDSLSFEEAFFIENVTTMDFMDDQQTEIVVFKRIYINSKSAAEEYSQREMFIGSSGRLSMIVGRIIKNDGSIIELKNDQIIETTMKKKNRYGTKTVRRVQLIYPNLEKGDVVDFAYEIHLDRYIISDLMYLEDELPSMYSRITLRNMSVFDITAYSLNAIPSVITKTIDGIRTFSWEKRGVKSIQTDYFNALSPKAPSFVFVLWNPGQDLDYRTFYTYDQFEVTTKFGIIQVATKYFTENGVIRESDDKFVNLKKIIFNIKEEFKWNDSGKNIAVAQTPSALRDKIVDETLFIRYLAKYMQEQNIRFEHGFTKSLLDGQFVHGFVSLEQMSSRFLIAYDQQNNLHFIFPPESMEDFYYMDEIPYYVEGNQSIALYGKREFLDEKAALELPLSTWNSNVHLANVLIDLTIKDSVECKVKRKDILNGHYSYLFRSSEATNWMQELSVIKDSIKLNPVRQESYYPYETEYIQENINGTYFEQLEDSLFWFNPKSFLPQGVFQSDETLAEFGDYLVLPFQKSNTVNVFIQTGGQIELAEEDVSMDFSNAIGDIKVKVTQMGEGVLKFQYDIAVKKRLIENEDEVILFKQLIQKYADIKNKKWAVKIS